MYFLNSHREYEKWNKRYKKFQKDNSQSITKMVLDFNRKKSADIAKKIKNRDIGILNERKLHTYKWNEKIFKSRKIIPEGKNHGLIILVDCSGSMQDNSKFESAIKQCLILVEFCRKVGIKYKVMGFSQSNMGFSETQAYRNQSENFLKFYHIPKLREWFSYQQNSKENEFMATYMLYKSKHYRSGYNADGPNSSTPLIDSMLVLRQIALKFKETEKIDILNTITLTDGVSNNSCLADTNKKTVGRISSYDPLTKSIYRTDNCSKLENILKFYKKVVGGNIIGFDITNGYYLREMVTIRENYFGYDHHYTFSFRSLYENFKYSSMKNNENNKSVEDIRKNFKNLNTSKNDKNLLLSKFIDIIS